MGILLILFWGWSALAANSTGAAVWTQVRNWEFCGDITRDDVRAAGFQCQGRDPGLFSFGQYSFDIIENLTFKEAAQRQIQKDSCVVETLDALKKRGNRRNQWVAELMATWLTSKKLEIISKNCEEVWWDQMSSETMFGSKEGSAVPRDKKDREGRTGGYEYYSTSLREYCKKDESFLALLAAPNLIQHAMPVLSSKELLGVLEANRDIVINTRTGKPVTNGEIMQMDLRDLSALELRINSKMGQDLDRFIEEYAKTKRPLVADLKKNINDLSGSQKDYLYEEGSVFEVMEAHNMIELDSNGRLVKVHRAASCIQAWYEPTLSGEAANLAASTAIPAGFLFKIFGGMKKFAILGKTRFGKAFNGGALISSIPLAVQQLYRECHSSVGKTQRLRKTERDRFISVQGESLPKNAGYQQYLLEFSSAEAPSCMGTKPTDDTLKPAPNLMENYLYRANCFAASLEQLAPVNVVFPGIRD